MSKPKFVNMVGERFVQLVVIEQAGRNTSRAVKWLCRCDCGNFVTATRQSLINGSVKSCGCRRAQRMRELTGERNVKWSGEEAGYGAIHSWVDREKTRQGQPKTGTCVRCHATPKVEGRTGTHWANISGDYLRDASDYRELCPRCNNLEKENAALSKRIMEALS